jgi:hypothetical protein
MGWSIVCTPQPRQRSRAEPYGERSTKNLHRGRRVYVLDDDGKDWKLTIVGKVAAKE